MLFHTLIGDTHAIYVGILQMFVLIIIALVYETVATPCAVNKRVSQNENLVLVPAFQCET